MGGNFSFPSKVGVFLFWGFFVFLFFCFCFFRAVPEAYGGSQARGQIGTTAGSLHHSYSNAGFLTPWARPGIEPESSWDTSPIRFCCDTMGTPPPKKFLSCFYSKSYGVKISTQSGPLLADVRNTNVKYKSMEKINNNFTMYLPIPATKSTTYIISSTCIQPIFCSYFLYFRNILKREQRALK